MELTARWLRLATATGVAAGVVTALPAARAPERPGAYVVTVAAGHLADAERAVTRAGGVVVSRLRALDALSVRVSPTVAQRVATAAGVLAVTPDAPMQLAGASAS